LLEFDADAIGELLLGHAQHPTTLADTLSNMVVYWMRHHSSFGTETSERGL